NRDRRIGERRRVLKRVQQELLAICTEDAEVRWEIRLRTSGDAVIQHLASAGLSEEKGDTLIWCHGAVGKFLALVVRKQRRIGTVRIYASNDVRLRRRQ